jgi:hypothetical protein
MAEGNAAGFATMFSADSYLQIGSGAASTFGSHSHKLAYSFLIQNLEGIIFQQVLTQVDG